MGRRKRKRKRVKAALRLFLALAFLTGTGTLLATKVFTVEKVEIVGSEYYPDEAIENGCWMTSIPGTASMCFSNINLWSPKKCLLWTIWKFL